MDLGRCCQVCEGGMQGSGRDQGNKSAWFCGEFFVGGISLLIAQRVCSINALFNGIVAARAKGDIFRAGAVYVVIVHPHVPVAWC